MLPFGLPRYTVLLLTLALAGLVGGCFRPLYGDQGVVGGPGILDKMRSVEVAPVLTTTDRRLPRVGGEVRNELAYGLTGGGAANTTEYRITITISGGNSALISDIVSGRADGQNYLLNASFSLVETSTGKLVLSGSTFSRVSFDLPGQQQRFSGDRALRDAENRAAKVIAENIRSRMASFFVTGMK